MPSYVDDVLEFESKTAFPEIGESGKIYVSLDTNLTYRWGGTEYVEISKSLALSSFSLNISIKSSNFIHHASYKRLSLEDLLFLLSLVTYSSNLKLGYSLLILLSTIIFILLIKWYFYFILFL